MPDDQLEYYRFTKSYDSLLWGVRGAVLMPFVTWLYPMLVNQLVPGVAEWFVIAVLVLNWIVVAVLLGAGTYGFRRWCRKYHPFLDLRARARLLRRMILADIVARGR
jgi:hypothetical protein